MVKRRSHSANRSSSPWANAFRDILVALISKGQFPLAIVGLIVVPWLATNKVEIETAMYYCIVILVCLAILHFICQSIIAPSLRLESRLEMPLARFRKSPVPGYAELMNSDLRKLPLEERLRLVEDLWDSIAADQGALPLTSQQQTELDRRLDAYEADGIRGRLAADVIADIRKTL
jgi:putative addiction module component (TIGR02574 family)